MKRFLQLFILQKNEAGLLIRISGLFVIMFFFYLVANFFLIRLLSINDTKAELRKVTSIIISDLEFSNGLWNTKKYLSDITIPSNLSTYIYSLDGFMIDRNNPVNGFLDTSNFEYASSFKTPRTISYIVNENWRLYSHDIVRNGQIKGVIFLAYFDPRGISETELDNLLYSNAQLIDKNIQVHDDRLDVTGVHQNEVDLNLSFEIIDQYNRVYITNGGPPAYIDKSYIQNVLSEKEFTIVTDRITGEKSLIYIQPLLFAQKPVGVVVVGQGLGFMDNILKKQFLLSFGAGILAVIVFTVGTMLVYKRDLTIIVQQKLTLANKPAIITVEKLQFDKSSGVIVINGQIRIEIPKDTYQFDICTLLFKHPSKHYDTFDLTDAIGERDEQKNIKRLMYDAVDAINERVMKIIDQKLIVHKDTQYFIHPDLASKIA